ncbi:MAG TPA: hypothetical protein P5096_01895 [Patescibacteria group bacterium]|nr:hypothetical protein [Patescibacteria group bacterium]
MFSEKQSQDERPNLDEKIKKLGLNESLKEIKEVSAQIEALGLFHNEEFITLSSDKDEKVGQYSKEGELSKEERANYKHLMELRKKLIFRALKLLYDEYNKGGGASITREQAFLLVQFTRVKMNALFGSEQGTLPSWKQDLQLQAEIRLHELEHFASSKPLSREKQNETLWQYGFINQEEYSKESKEIEKLKELQKEAA